MAATVTHLSTTGAQARTVTSPSNSFAAGDIIVVFAAFANQTNGAVTGTISDSGIKTGSWTQAKANSSNGQRLAQTVAWWAVANGSSGTVTVTDPVTGKNNYVTTVVVSKINQAGGYEGAMGRHGHWGPSWSSNVNATLGFTPAADSVQLAALFIWENNACTGISATLGWTEISDPAAVVSAGGNGWGNTNGLSIKSNVQKGVARTTTGWSLPGTNDDQYSHALVISFTSISTISTTASGSGVGGGVASGMTVTTGTAAPGTGVGGGSADGVSYLLVVGTAAPGVGTGGGTADGAERTLVVGTAAPGVGTGGGTATSSLVIAGSASGSGVGGGSATLVDAPVIAAGFGVGGGTASGTTYQPITAGRTAVTGTCFVEVPVLESTGSEIAGPGDVVWPVSDEWGSTFADVDELNEWLAENYPRLRWDPISERVRGCSIGVLPRLTLRST